MKAISLIIVVLPFQISRLLDLLADLMGDDIVSPKMTVSHGNDDYVYHKIHFSSFVVLVCQ